MQRRPPCTLQGHARSAAPVDPFTGPSPFAVGDLGTKAWCGPDDRSDDDVDNYQEAAVRPCDGSKIA